MKLRGTQRSVCGRNAALRPLNPGMRGQIEIMGLVVIVILVTLGMFFSVALQNDEKTKITTIYTDERLSGDFLITLLGSHAAHCDAEIEDLARDAVLGLFNRSSYSCGGLDSRSYVNLTIDTVLNDTLELWGRDFELNFSYSYGEDVVPLYYKRQGCRLGQDKTAPGFQAIHLYPEAPGTALFTLVLCN